MSIPTADTHLEQEGHEAKNPQVALSSTPPSAAAHPTGVEPTDRRRMPRFGIRSLLLITLVISVMSACTSYLVKAILNGSEFKVIFVSLTVAAPTLLLVVVSTITWAIRSMPTRAARK